MNRIFAVFALIVFYSCDSATESAAVSKDTVVVVQKEEKDFSWREEIEEESKELETRLDTLEKRIESISGEAKTQTNEAIEKLRRKKDEVLSDTARNRVKSEWEDLKKSVKDLSDSLDKKI